MPILFARHAPFLFDCHLSVFTTLFDASHPFIASLYLMESSADVVISFNPGGPAAAATVARTGTGEG